MVVEKDDEPTLPLSIKEFNIQIEKDIRQWLKEFVVEIRRPPLQEGERPIRVNSNN